MGAMVLEAVARIVHLGGTASRAELVRAMRARFETATGAYTPEDPWFEERSRAFWTDAVTRGRFGRDVEGELTADEQTWLGPLERAHRGLFRASASEGRDVLTDVWSGAVLELTAVDDSSRAELNGGSGQLIDARVVGHDDPLVIALLPGAIFHPSDATSAIEGVLAAAREKGLGTHETLDALLRMERTLRALSRVKVGYAYRADSLFASATPHPMRRLSKGPS